MKKIKEKIKAVIFDMDGTIIQTESIWDEATKKVLIQKGISLENEKEKKLYESIPLGLGLHIFWEKLQKTFNLAEHNHMTLAEECIGHIEEQFKNGNIQFIPGFEDFHKKLCLHKIPTCIATNCDDKSLAHLTKSMNLSQFFGNKIFNISTVEGKAKPDPALFLHAAKELNVDPKECVVFEDSLAGFQAARDAGMRCIAIKNNYNSNEINHANAFIDHYDLAHEALNQLTSYPQFIPSKTISAADFLKKP